MYKTILNRIYRDRKVRLALIGMEEWANSNRFRIKI